jgi:DnaA family protein
MYKQLPLGVSLRDSASFENYYQGCHQQEVLQCLQAVAEGEGEPFVYLWGGSGAGKTHLLQAACRYGADQDKNVVYLPLSEVHDYSLEMLLGLEQLDLVCIDDLHRIAGNTIWQNALFDLFNRLRESGSHLVMAADNVPAAVGITLPDLESRLTWGVIYQLHTLDDQEKLKALQLRARGRGVELPDEVAQYLLRRCPRDMHALFELLEQLDYASLAAQRRLTVPFVRELI